MIKGFRCFLISILIFSIILPGVTLAANHNANKKNAFVSTEIIVKYKTKTAAAAVKNNVKKKKKLKKISTKAQIKSLNTELLEISANDDAKAVAEALKNDPNVEYAEPNYMVELFFDPMFDQQWGLKNTGQTVNGNAGTSGIDINISRTLAENAQGVTVAVIDTGVDVSHPDLAENIFTNTNENANNTDDDGNGFIDDICGWNFSDYIDETNNGNNTVYASPTEDEHGTHIAGIIGASLNGQGIEGVSPNAKILPVKFIKGTTGTVFNAIKAIAYAQSMGAQIANISWGTPNYSTALYEAIASSDMLFVCAAGNNGQNVENTPVYPACFDLDNVASVAAINNQGALAPFSNYGEGITAAAPGVDILSTTPDGGYQYMSGSSMAAPFVTGIAALIKGLAKDISPKEMIEAIKNNLSPPIGNDEGLLLAGVPNVSDAIKTFAATATPPDDINVKIDYQNNVVTLTKPAAEDAVDATCYVEDKNRKLVYIGSVPVVNGNYALSFGLKNPASGTYTGKFKVQGGEMTDILFALNNDYVSKKRTSGYEYEQSIKDQTGVPAPEILQEDVQIEVLDFIKGIYRLTISGDDVATPFFFWETEEGTFTDVKNASGEYDYRSVIFYADPGTGDKAVCVVVGVGDGLGRVDKKAIYLKGNDER